VCRPEKLRQHVPEEREALLSIKRACAAQLAQSLMGRWRVQVGAEALSPFEQQQHTAGGVAAGPSTHRRGACQGQRPAASRFRELPRHTSPWQPTPSLCITHASPQSLLQPAFPPPLPTATAWRERLGRGVVAAYMSNLAYSASIGARDKCQLYAFYFPERDYPSRVARIPRLKMGGWWVEWLPGCGGEQRPVICHAARLQGFYEV